MWGGRNEVLLECSSVMQWLWNTCAFHPSPAIPHCLVIPSCTTSGLGVVMWGLTPSSERREGARALPLCSLNVPSPVTANGSVCWAAAFHPLPPEMSLPLFLPISSHELVWEERRSVNNLRGIAFWEQCMLFSRGTSTEFAWSQCFGFFLKKIHSLRQLLCQSAQINPLAPPNRLPIIDRAHLFFSLYGSACVTKRCFLSKLGNAPESPIYCLHESSQCCSSIQL